MPPHLDTLVSLLLCAPHVKTLLDPHTLQIDTVSTDSTGAGGNLQSKRRSADPIKKQGKLISIKAQNLEPAGTAGFFVHGP